MTDFPLAPDRVRFRALARTFIPALARSPSETWDALESAMTGALASRPAAMIRQLRLLVRVLDWACRVRFGRSLDQVDDARRLQLLQAFERAPVQLVRRGIWGLRTLVFMGYYTQAPVIAALGYRATPGGWDARR